jgi:hypothetical protein
MEIEQKKKRFLDILFARQTTSGDRIIIEDVALKENGLDDRTFWSVICPKLQAEGVLKHYDDPDLVSSDFVQFCMKTSPDHEYERKFSQRWKLRSLEGIEGRAAEGAMLDAEMREIEAGLRKSFKHRFNVDWKELSKAMAGANKNNKTTASIFIFELTKDGILSRKDTGKKSSPYSIEKGSRRHEIFKELVMHDAFCDTEKRAKRVECTPEEFRKDVNGLRKLMRKHFGTKTMDIIESKQRSGYRINPQTSIIPIS